jgi:putative peptidoglycan lipid II flippase
MKGSTYLLMVFGILIAKGLGFGRNIFFASAFGASGLTDIYFQIFGIATFIFTGIGTALSTLVIKNLNKEENCTPYAQKHYVSYFIQKISLIIIAVLAVMYLAAGPIVRLLLPGLDPSLYEAARQMLYIMLPSGLFIVVAYIMSGVLQNSNVFFITSIMSLPYNVIIIGALLLAKPDIFAISWITTLGWFLHIAILLPDFYRKGFRFFYRNKNQTSALVKQRNLEVFYIFISSMMFQVCFMLDKAAVSHITGAGTTINYANTFFVTIASIFVVAMSNASFPSISKNYESGNGEAIKETTRQLILLLFIIIIPFLIFAFFFGQETIALLYERGEFTSDLTKETALLFFINTLGIFGYVCQDLFNKFLYLGSRYFFPVVGSISIILLKWISNQFIADYGVIPVSIATTILLTVYAIVIFLAMLKVTGNFLSRSFGINLLKVFIAGLVATGICLLFDWFFPHLPGGKIAFILPLFLCFALYIAILWICGVLKIALPNRNTQE